MKSMFEEDPDSAMEALGEMLSESFPKKGFVLLVFNDEETTLITNRTTEDAKEVMQAYLSSPEDEFQPPSTTLH